MLTPFCKEMILLTDKYFECFAHEKLDVPTAVAFYASFNPKADESAIQMATDQLLQLNQEEDPEAISGLMRSLQELSYATRLSQISMDYDAGEDIDIFEATRFLEKEFSVDLKRTSDVQWCDTDIEDLLEEETHGVMYNWRLGPLRESMPNLRPGDQIIVAARPGRGKTSFIYNQITGRGMSGSLPQGTCICVFNNEGKANKARKTAYRAGLGCTTQELVSAGGESCRVAWQKYVGPLDCIRIFDVHGMNIRQIESIIEQNNPGIVVWDMLDNIKGFQNADRKDTRLEELYQWAREQAVIHDFLSIATSQISADGEGVEWCSQDMLKDSKVGKQGACDAIVMIGTSADPMKQFNKQDKAIRFINVPKTKYVPNDGSRDDCKVQVLFNQQRASYEDPK